MPTQMGADPVWPAKATSDDGELCMSLPDPMDGIATVPEDAVLDLETIYQPVVDELAELEAYLDRVIASGPGEIEQQLRHVLKNGGKRIRPAITLLCGKFFDYNLDLLIPMATSVELLHTATLLHDDTVDKSLLRRGRLTANSLWGDTNAVLLGDYLCAASASLVAELGKKWIASGHEVPSVRNIQAMEILAQTIMRLCSGAIEESLHRFNMTKEDYFRRIGNKTASLFSSSAQTGAILSGAPEEAVESVRRYGHNVGIAFQIVDDMLDFEGDLAKDSMSLPGILLLERPENAWLAEMIAGDREQGCALMIEMASETNIMSECRAIARSFCNEACLALADFPQNAVHRSLVNMAFFIMDRKS